MSCLPQLRVGLVIFLLPSMVIAAEINDGHRSVPKAANGQWSTIEADNYTIYYGKDFAEDAQKAKTFLDSTIESLTKEFVDYQPEEILNKIECHFYLHPEPNEKAFDGRSVCISRGLGDGRRHVEVHFLTPARYSPHSRNPEGELKKADHTFFRYIVHEYGSSWLGVILRSKEKGWGVNGKDAPNWFWQGYEEYLGMTLSSDHSRKVTFSKYMALIKNDPDQVMVAYGYRDKTPRIVVRNDYRNGFAVLAFMHDHFGRKAVQDILTSEKETFRESMKDCLQMDVAEFYEKYQKWVEEWEGP